MSPMNFICEYYVDLLFTSNDCFNSRLIVIHHAEIHKLAILAYKVSNMDNVLTQMHCFDSEGLYNSLESCGELL